MWAGVAGVIYASAHLGQPFRAESMMHFRRYRDFRRVVADKMPYQNTYLIPILLSVRMIRVSFHHPRGAISIVRFSPPRLKLLRSWH